MAPQALVRLILILLSAVVGCDDTSRRAAPKASVEPTADVTRWARTLDSLSSGTSSKKFGFPSRSTEGGTGHFYRLADSSVRIDIDDSGEMGKHRERYYARHTALRLAVTANDYYDQPLSGQIIRSAVDSVWFEGDSAVRWIDSLHVLRTRPDSIGSHGAEVFAQFLWAIRMAGAKPAPDPQR